MQSPAHRRHMIYLGERVWPRYVRSHKAKMAGFHTEFWGEGGSSENGGVCPPFLPLFMKH